MSNHTSKVYKEEIEHATKKITSIITKISYYLLIDYQNSINNELNMDNIFLEDLDVSKELMDFYVKKLEDISVLGRFDWIIDKQNNLKCIEFNAETPAFQSDSIISDEVFYEKWLEYYKHLYIKTKSKMKKEKLNIFCLCDMYYEDEIKDTLFLENCLNFQINIVDTIRFYKEAYWEDDKLYFDNKIIDVLWHPNTPLKEINDQTETFIKDLEKNKNIVLWNSPISSLYSNKFLYALMHEIVDKDLNILTDDEKDFIQKTVPYTSKNVSKIKNKLHVKQVIKKPCIGSCGEDVTIELVDNIPDKEKGFIYQEYIEPSTLSKTADDYINVMSFISISDNIEQIKFLGYSFKISDKKIFDDTSEFMSFYEYDNLFNLNNKY